MIDIQKNEDLLNTVAQSLRRIFYRNTKFHLEEKEGDRDFKQHLYMRYNRAKDHIVPWISKVLDWREAKVLEVGCGSGAGTVAYGQMAKHISAFDINVTAVEMARARADAFGLKNVTVAHTKPTLPLSQLIEESGETFNLIILFAVLEHCTIEERIAYLRDAWQALPPGGHLVIGESPNRLTYFDHHNTRLPFAHMLPIELLNMYSDHIPRGKVREQIQGAPKGYGHLKRRCIRFGLFGLSFHEFELALGPDYGEYVVADGWDKEIASTYTTTLEAKILLQYMRRKQLLLHRGFALSMLSFIFRKPE